MFGKYAVRYFFGLILIMIFINGLAYGRGVGTSGSTALNMGVGARSVAMGEASAAVSDDVSGIYWNPAGLVQILQPQLSAMHLEWLGGIRYEWVGYVQPIAKWGAIGADVSYVYMGDMVRTLESHTEGYEEDGTFNYSDMSGRIAFSGKFMEDILLGGSIQILQSNVRFDGVTRNRVGDRKAQSTAINLGCIYNTPVPNFTAGASLRNMGNQTKAFFDEEEPLPFSFRLGASYRTLVSKPEDQPIVEDEEISSPEEVFGKLPNALLLAVDLHFPADNSFGLRMGGEYRFSNGIAVRGGYRTGTGLEFPYGLSGGAGYKTESYQVDYAIVPYGDIGSTHRFSLTIVF